MVYLDIPGNIALIHYTNDTMVVRQNEQDVAIMREGLGVDIHTWGWKTNPMKIQESVTPVMFIRVQYSGLFWDDLSRVKYKVLYLTSPTTKREPRYLMGLFVYWRQYIPHVGVLCSPKFK